MATKLYLTGVQNNGIGAGEYDMRTSGTPGAGSETDQGWSETVASGTEIQFDLTSGASGQVIEWVSGRTPAGGFTLSGAMNFSFRARESNMNANIGMRARVYRRTPAGVYTEVGGGPFNDGVELGTSNAVMTWSGTPSAGLAFAENDRVVVRFFITNVGTMGGGFQGIGVDCLELGGYSGAFLELNETVTFKPDVPSVSGGSAADSGRNWDTPYQDITVTFDDAVAQSGIAVGDGSGVHGVTIKKGGAAQTTEYRSGSGTNSWVFRIPVLCKKGDVLTVSYSRTTGNILSSDTGNEVNNATDVALTNSLTKRVRVILKDKNNAVLNAVTVKYAVQFYASGDPSQSTWMSLLDALGTLIKGTQATTSAGLLDLSVENTLPAVGDTVYVTVFQPNASPTESMIWTTTVV